MARWYSGTKARPWGLPSLPENAPSALLSEPAIASSGNGRYEKIVRSAVEYDLFVPVFAANGRKVSQSLLRSLREELLEHFGGLTLFRQRNLGLWKFGRYLYRDEIVILRVVTENVRAGRAFFRVTKQKLEARLEQKSILVIERRIGLV
jgi:hypothetical protein